MSHCTLALVGFDSETTQNLKRLVDKSYLDLRIEFIQVVKAGDNFQHRIEEEFDIILLSGHVCTDGLIPQLRELYPLSEVVIISHERNYDFVIQAFKNGVRDIIEYPFTDDDFLTSLERSQSFRSLYHKSESLTDILILLNQFGDFKKFSSKLEMMMKFDDFIMRKIGGEALIVLSFPTKFSDDQTLEGRFRVIWNQSLMSKGYTRDGVKDLLDRYKCKTLRDTDKAYIEVASGDEYYYIIPLEGSHNNNYIGIFKLEKDKRTDYVDKILSHFGRIMQNVYYQLQLYKENEDLSSLVHVDDVTGAFNQRRLLEDLDHCVEKYKKMEEPFCVIFIDIDHFKTVNDGHGHLVGSQLLVEVAEVLRDCLRDEDLIYRYGGDEFVVIIPAVDAQGGREIGERVLKDIKQHKFISSAKKTFKLSVSIGVAAFPEDADTKKAILQIADDMMYKAKNSGRGRVISTKEMFQEGDTPPKSKSG